MRILLFAFFALFCFSASAVKMNLSSYFGVRSETPLFLTAELLYNALTSTTTQVTSSLSRAELRFDYTELTEGEDGAPQERVYPIAAVAYVVADESSERREFKAQFGQGFTKENLLSGLESGPIRLSCSHNPKLDEMTLRVSMYPNSSDQIAISVRFWNTAVFEQAKAMSLSEVGLSSMKAGDTPTWQQWRIIRRAAERGWSIEHLLLLMTEFMYLNDTQTAQALEICESYPEETKALVWRNLLARGDVAPESAQQILNYCLWSRREVARRELACIFAGTPEFEVSTAVERIAKLDIDTPIVNQEEAVDEDGEEYILTTLNSSIAYYLNMADRLDDIFLKARVWQALMAKAYVADPRKMRSIAAEINEYLEGGMSPQQKLDLYSMLAIYLAPLIIRPEKEKQVRPKGRRGARARRANRQRMQLGNRRGGAPAELQIPQRSNQDLDRITFHPAGTGDGGAAAEPDRDDDSDSSSGDGYLEALRMWGDG